MGTHRTWQALLHTPNAACVHPFVLCLLVVRVQAVLQYYLDMALDDIGCRDSQCHAFRGGYKNMRPQQPNT